MTQVRRINTCEKLITNLAQFAADMHSYLTDPAASGVKKKVRTGCKTLVEERLPEFKGRLKTDLICGMAKEMDHLFETSLKHKVHEGSYKAIDAAQSTVTKWGSKARILLSYEGKIKIISYGSVYSIPL